MVRDEDICTVDINGDRKKDTRKKLMDFFGKNSNTDSKCMEAYLSLKHGLKYVDVDMEYERFNLHICVYNEEAYHHYKMLFDNNIKFFMKSITELYRKGKCEHWEELGIGSGYFWLDEKGTEALIGYDHSYADRFAIKANCYFPVLTIDEYDVGG